MKYLIFFIFLIFSFFWTKIIPCAFTDDNKNKVEVIVVDEIILSTEDLEDDDLDENIAESLEQLEQKIKTEKNEEKNEIITGSSDQDYDKGNLYEARKALSTSFFSATAESNRSKIKAQLDEINRKLVFSQTLSPDSFFYTVKGGDTLSKIAGTFNTTYELIMLTNNKYRTDIRVGERLKIIKGTFNILVDKSDFTLTVLLNNDYIKQYKVGTGKDDKTPLGDFEIAEKMKEPTWYADDGIYEFGHPKNVLGTRWIGFKDKPGIYGYGIHGTAAPDSIGKMESNGCIRLKNEDVEELYSFVTENTKVVIQK